MVASPASVQLPDWLSEPLSVLTARRRLVVAVAVGIVLVAAMVSLVAPGLLPPRAIVGAAVGVAAALLATAVALTLDASDLVVRGPRHVTAAGGSVDVRVSRDHTDVAPLVSALARHAGGSGPVRVALVPASRSAAVPGPRAATLAEHVAKTGRRVLFTDLSRSGTPAAGLSDVVAGSRQLPEVVRFEQDMYLARLAVGSDPDRALQGLPGFVARLPSDLEVLVAAMPPLAEPGALQAAEAFDLAFLLVEVDRTDRVDLIASLDALDTSPVDSQLVLIGADTLTTAAPAPVVPEAPVVPDSPHTGEADEPAEPTRPDEPADVPAEADVLADLLAVDERAPDDVEDEAPAPEDVPVEEPVPPDPDPAAGIRVVVSDEMENDAGEPLLEPRIMPLLPLDETEDEPLAAAYAFETTTELPVPERSPAAEDVTDLDDTPEPDALPDRDDVPVVEPASAAPGVPPVPPVPPTSPFPEPELVADPEPVAERHLAADLEPAAEAEPEPEAEPEAVIDLEARAAPAPVAEAEPDDDRPAPDDRPADDDRQDTAAAVDLPDSDPAAVEAARTSAALYQLAHQVWDRPGS